VRPTVVRRQVAERVLSARSSGPLRYGQKSAVPSKGGPQKVPLVPYRMQAIAAFAQRDSQVHGTLHAPMSPSFAPPVPMHTGFTSHVVSARQDSGAPIVHASAHADESPDGPHAPRHVASVLQALEGGSPAFLVSEQRPFERSQ